MSAELGRVPNLGKVASRIELADPVLIAPHGSQYHNPVVLASTFDGPALWRRSPVCGAAGQRWVAVDEDFAKLLDRALCERCQPPDAEWTQTRISDDDPTETETTKEKP